MRRPRLRGGDRSTCPEALNVLRLTHDELEKTEHGDALQGKEDEGREVWWISGRAWEVGEMNCFVKRQRDSLQVQLSGFQGEMDSAGRYTDAMEWMSLGSDGMKTIRSVQFVALKGKEHEDNGRSDEV
ncbi:MAG: hypothetical protein H0U76_20815 [Ktedonobacteraceae bacterium]|nr:hypothetical protein [Ktedonobacteraceae bacterium]